MNRWIGVGNLTNDPTFTTTSNGFSVCRFSIAISRKFKQEGQEPEADFINIVTWRGLADNCAKFLKKGSKVGISGPIQTRTYDAQDGTKKYVTEIIADEVEFLTPKTTEGKTPVKTEASVKQEVMQKFEPVDTDNLPF